MEAADTTLTITPKRESLLKRSGPVQCTEKGCTHVLESISHLNMHLAKRHGREHLLQKSVLRKMYHCPETECNYSKRMHFKQFKSLKQHYLKVHAEKSIVCGLCGKSFSVERALKCHEEYCGIVFNCSECSTSYPCYESLQTHCRRKKHKLLAKASYKKIQRGKEDLQAGKDDGDICSKQKMLLPKGCDTYIVLVAAKQGGLDKSCQTEKQQICVETQTTADVLRVKSTNGDSERISTETQTSKTKSCNTNQKLNLTDDPYVDGVEQKNSSTQTNINKDDQLLMDFDTTFFNCNTETQTDLFSDALLNNCDFYTNMYTQTPSCDDMLLDDLEFNDTYTQTALYDDVRSVESQTMLYNNYKKGLLLCRDVAHNETQTDLEVKQILEEMV